MSLPLALPSMGHTTTMLIALALGFGFGFVLERAGFGRANKLAAQFYLYDMTVFKVMFTGIVVAMLGVLLLSGLGWLDLAGLTEAALSFTYLWPMILGGFLLGVGFIISGYCPGTSVVAAASGNLDGLVTVLGVVLGSVLYAEFQPLYSAFHQSGDMGWLTLYGLVGVPPALVGLAVVLMAAGGFLGGEWVERRFQAGRTADSLDPAPGTRGRSATFGVFAAVTALALLTLAIPHGDAAATAPRQAQVVTASALAHRMFEQPWQTRILDLRDPEACGAARLPDSECTPEGTLADLGLQWDPGARDLLLVGAGTIATVPEPVQAYRGEVFVLDGGFAAWNAYALTAPARPAPDATQAERDEYAFRAGLNAALTGVAAPPAPVAAPTTVIAPKKRKGGGGCG